jgi:hypothetical protein
MLKTNYKIEKPTVNSGRDKFCYYANYFSYDFTMHYASMNILRNASNIIQGLSPNN